MSDIIDADDFEYVESNEVIVDSSTEETETQDKHFIEATQFLGLIEKFDTKAQHLEQNLINNKHKIGKDIDKIKAIAEIEEVPQELNITLIESDELLSDFVMIRETLRDDIKITRGLIKSLGSDMSTTSTEDLSGNLVLAFAELKKGNVQSIKLLMDSYSSVAETQLKVKKLITEIKEQEDLDDPSVTNIQNNFIGTSSDILKQLKESIR